jgi:hypothetical protein
MKALRKKKGSAPVADMIAILLTIAICGCMLLFFTAQIKYLDICNRVNNTARRTILKMESTRGLTDTDKQDVIRELEEYGIFNISLEGTTGYDSRLRPGDDISLCVSGSYRMDEFRTEGMLDIAVPGVERQIYVERSSVVLR